jgi:integrase
MSAMSLDELRAEYIAKNQRIQSLKTIRLLNVVVSNFEKYLQRQATVDDLSDEGIAEFRKHRRTEGMADSTVDGEVAKLLALKRYAAARGISAQSILRFRRTPPPTPVALLKWQIRKLWKAAYRADGVVGPVPARIFWPALLDVLWDSGERIYAVYSLERPDIDARTRWVTFRQRKGNGRVMHKRMRRVTIRNLQRLIEAHDEPQVFGVVSPATIYSQYSVLLAKAGLPTDRHSKFHCLRKSHASYLHAAGGDSRASLGHSTEAVTIQHYHDPRVTLRKQPLDFLFNPLGLWGRILCWFGK